ncbi:flagellar hook-length control protein FliK [Evansella sp. AB-rgal1]|uniref:flagellar hook-length control protein FliK n=1 Tax=Evansella sp. AB-rgal1 TaxID=3242696 RepID=UPI00359DB473
MMNELMGVICNVREKVSYGTSAQKAETNTSFSNLIKQFMISEEDTNELTSAKNDPITSKLNDIDVSGISINISMLEMEEVSQLISLLPDELASETLVLLEKNTPMEELLQHLDKLSHIVAIVIAGIHGEQTQETNSLNESSVFSLIAGLVTSYESNNKQEDQITTWEMVGAQLMKHVSKQIEKNTKNSDLDSIAKLEKNEQLSILPFQKIVTLVNSTPQLLDDKNGTPILLGNNTLNQLTGTHPALSVQNGEQQMAQKELDQQLQKQIQSILARSQFKNIGNGVQQLLVKLHPESLGRLEINIQQLNGILIARMVTSTATTKEMLEGQLQQLRSAFQANHLQVERIEVTQQQGQQLLNKDPQEEQKRQQFLPDDEKEKESTEGDGDSFSVFLEETINVKV